MTPDEQLWQLLRGSLTARALGIAADLGVSDALADGSRPVAEVAAEVDADPDTLHRLLRALASDGVFAEEEPGVFRNTAASELLQTGWGDFAHLFGGVFHRTAGALDASGRPSFPAVFGTDFWSYLAAHPDERAAFDRAMEQGKERRVARLAEIEWREGETVVDVGGGNGSFLAALLAEAPELRGIVFDLPETVRDDDALAAAGIEFVEGSFFERVPAGDTYVLGTILHDWPDEQAAAILCTIREHAPAGARVLILDDVVPPGNDAHGGKWLDLLMLAFAGGRERTEAEWRALVADAGLELEALGDRLIEARAAQNG
jgi:O-methyltransferase domain/Dimerisation domain